MKIGYVLAILSRLWSIYVSKQFFKYIVCGGLSSLVHVIARLILSNYMDYGWAVFTSYFIGMPVALILYRYFVFNGREGRAARQFFLFSITYFGFLPVTWMLSVAAERPLEELFPRDRAQLMAHLVGVVGPVVLNFAYNKFITFGERLQAGPG
jgi:putative flippase GtrA